MPSMTTQTQAVLAALLGDPTVYRYGLEISREVGYPGGTIYPILARLETAGWVESEWEDIDPKVEGRRRRRYYRITAEGERAAREVLAETAKRLAPLFRDVPGQVASA
jgi:PadR family transcriptional regulator, regulatory protein PadR